MKTNKLNTQKSLFLKTSFIFFLALLLLIPISMVKDLIRERQSREQEVQREIATSWGPSQKIIGPILSIPFDSEVENGDKKTITRHILRLTPNNLKIDVELVPEIRKKSIYKAILYSSSHQLNGDFVIPDLKLFGNNLKQVYWEEAMIDFGFESAASLSHIVSIQLNGKDYLMHSGASNPDLFTSGIHTQVNVDTSFNKIIFSSKIQLNGSKLIRFIPIANNMSVNMKSSWQDPGFVGLPLPQTRDLSKNGFNANWSTTEYNRKGRSSWINDAVNLNHRADGFGVDLIQTIGHYQKNMRSAKYALLIVGLSFLVFFFFEILKGRKIHAIEYVFLGLSLSIFYLLLLSFSEYVGFNIAYIISSISVIFLITWYSKKVIKDKRTIALLGSILFILYAYIFTLLQMEDYALLVGSIGLFTCLFISMYLSRNMNWYKITSFSTQSNIS